MACEACHPFLKIEYQRKVKKLGNKLRKMWGELSKREQLQLKVWFCMLGLGLLFLLLGVRVITALLEFDEKKNVPESVPEHIPVIELLTNVWIMDADEVKVQIFRDGVEEILYFASEFGMDEMLSEMIRAADLDEQIADIELTDGRITAVQVKKERIHGTVLSASPDSLELEGYGRLPLASDYKGYRIYNTLVMCGAEDLPFGYDFADFTGIRSGYFLEWIFDGNI